MFGVGAEIQNAVSCQRFTAGGSNSRIVRRIAGQEPIGNFDFAVVRVIGHKERFRLLIGFGFCQMKDSADTVVAVFFFGSVHSELADGVTVFNNGRKGTVAGFYSKARHFGKILTAVRRVHRDGDGGKLVGCFACVDNSTAAVGNKQEVAVRSGTCGTEII